MHNIWAVLLVALGALLAAVVYKFLPFSLGSAATQT